jgi:hypothetical protein
VIFAACGFAVLLQYRKRQAGKTGGSSDLVVACAASYDYPSHIFHNPPVSRLEVPYAAAHPASVSLCHSAGNVRLHEEQRTAIKCGARF